jgi:serine/threonine-protein kinase
MATVYLARDLRHERPVAVKLLNPELGAVLGAERFLSEIRVTANLQHPNLLPLFDSGEANGLLFYVMPYVEGESLRARLDREKQLPIDDAVRIAAAIAGALDYAHRHGVIHRDLKPENVLLHDGQPLVADFGIALAVSNAGGARVTQTGLSLGTPQYMSPEQATGDRAIDSRTDIYSLGALTYEMLAGEPPHSGATAQAIIARLMTEEPRPLTSTRRNVPPHVDAAVRHALEKLPADRFATAKEFAHALTNPGFSDSSGAGPTSGAVGERFKRRFLVAAAAALLLLVIAVAFGARLLATRRFSATPGSSIHVRLPLAPGDKIAVSPQDAIINSERPSRTAFAFSPDGQTLVFSGDRGGVRQLFQRQLVAESETPIAGTESGESPFFSPDGRSLGFWSNGVLRRLPLSGGPVTDIATVSRIVGASWGENDRIVVGTTVSGLIVYSASGGKPDTLTESGAILPQWLPGAKAILFTRSSATRASDRNPRIEVVSLDGGKPRVVIDDGADARIVSSGLLLFARRGTLVAVPFDARRAEVIGSPVVVLDDVMQAMNGSAGGARVDAAQVAVSAAGHLAWIPGGITPDRPGSVLWLARRGIATPIEEVGERQFHGVRFSPDEKRFAVTTIGTNPSLQVFDIERRSSQVLKTIGQPRWPLWTPDGQHVLRGGMIGDTLTIVSSRADDSRPATSVARMAIEHFPAFWSHDGSELFAVHSGGTGLTGIVLATGASREIANLPSEVRWPTLSPDGHWLAFGSTIAGGTDVYVLRWPALDRKWKVSTAGGTAPAWAKQGRELLYLQPAGVDSIGLPRHRMMAVDIASGGDFSAGTPHPLFVSPSGSATPVRSWDVTADGSQFLMTVVRPVRAPAGEIHLLVNWLKGFPELAQQDAGMSEVKAKLGKQ